MERKKGVLVFFIAVIFLISFSTAEFNFDEDYTLESTYAEGDYVRGEIIMNFTNQENSEFTSNFKGGTNLYDLLLNTSYQKNSDFTCAPVGCKDDYETDSDGLETQTFSLENKKLYGFRLSVNKLNDINNIKFNVTSDVGESCQNQLSVDLLNDGKIDFQNNKYVDQTCGEKNYGCFKDDEFLIDPVIIGKRDDDSDPYCEKIDNIPSAPAYRVGARIEKVSSQSDLEMFFYKVNETSDGVSLISALGGCKITSPSSGDVDCIVANYSKEIFDGYVCLWSASDTDYKIRVRQAFDSCGARGVFTGSIKNRSFVNSDYEIYAQPLKYAPIGTTGFSGTSLTNSVKNYLSEVYSNNCSKGCVIPFAFSGISQQITLDSANLQYEDPAGSRSTSKLFKLSQKPFTISSSDFLSLGIEKMKFLVPDQDGIHDFKLFFNDEELFEDEIEVEIGFDFVIGPRSVLIGRPTTFIASTSQTIVSSTWNFGDRSLPVASSDNKAVHVYSSAGEYQIEVTLRNVRGEVSTKKFKVIIGNPKTSANLTLQDYKSRIITIKSDINKLPEWTRKKITEQIAVEDIEREINQISDNYESIRGDRTQDYTEIVNQLADLNVPNSVSITETGSLPAEIGFSNINLEYLAKVSDADLSKYDSDNLNSVLLSWIAENYNMKISFETIFSLTFSEKRNLARKYKIELTEKNDVEEAYLIIDHPLENLDFKSQYDENSITDTSATYIKITEGEPKVIEFLISGETLPSVEELAVYISPVISELKAGKPFSDEILRRVFNWKRFSWSLGFIFLGILVVYLILQTWYKNHYEKSLFKNSNDLYNLVNFIYNARKSDLDDKEAREKLLNKGWKREQLTYAFKKIDGKRTGMWEIPIFKFAENRKVKKEIKLRQGAPVDTRFIKRQGIY
ncbi:PKD domain-containing protein [Candidatus Pacearchaeota archaeon]|nr:PKD domain-containing protein [Candidatus Pacearchaeota archaeon]